MESFAACATGLYHLNLTSRNDSTRAPEGRSPATKEAIAEISRSYTTRSSLIFIMDCPSGESRSGSRDDAFASSQTPRRLALRLATKAPGISKYPTAVSIEVEFADVLINIREATERERERERGVN